MHPSGVDQAYRFRCACGAVYPPGQVTWVEQTDPKYPSRWSLPKDWADQLWNGERSIHCPACVKKIQEALG